MDKSSSGPGEGGVEGVAELKDNIRCTYDWWNEVTDQLQDGCLSEQDWQYLRSYAVQGCRLPAERASRRRVINGADDPRLQEGWGHIRIPFETDLAYR
eukprot:201059-Amphidinium_carterae.1